MSGQEGELWSFKAERTIGGRALQGLFWNHFHKDTSTLINEWPWLLMSKYLLCISWKIFKWVYWCQRVVLEPGPCGFRLNSRWVSPYLLQSVKYKVLLPFCKKTFDTICMTLEQPLKLMQVFHIHPVFVSLHIKYFAESILFERAKLVEIWIHCLTPWRINKQINK